MLYVLEAMRYVLLCMLEAVKDGRFVLELLEVCSCAGSGGGVRCAALHAGGREGCAAMCCVLLCMLEVLEALG
jgi:hypothetical protein